MNRKTWCIVAGLLSIAAVEFALLASSAAVPAGARSAPVHAAFGGPADARGGAATGALMNAVVATATSTPTPLPATATPTAAPTYTSTPTPTPTPTPFLCFTGDTLIRTSAGEVRIDQLRPGDDVVSYDHASGALVSGRVASVFSRDVRGYLKVHLSDGTVIRVTDEHPFFDAATGSYRAIKSFRAGDSLSHVTAQGLVPATIASVERIDEEVTVYNLHVDDDNHNYVAAGVLVHNKTPTASATPTFTSTATPTPTPAPEPTRPANDNFANALPIGGGWGSTKGGDTTGATREPGEPVPNCVGSIGHTVWYELDSSSLPAIGEIDLDTIGSGFDTVLAVYTGSLGSLTQVACNDDFSGIGLLSRLTWGVSSGTYWIQVGSWGGGPGGNYMLHLAQTPTPTPTWTYPGTFTPTSTSTATPTPPPGTGSISGIVTDALGTPIAGAWVCATPPTVWLWACGMSVADGTYVITGLLPDAYRVQASGPYCPPGPTSPPCVSYVYQYYNDTYDYSAATLVTATSGTTTPNINFALAVGGSIAGTVTNTLGTPIAGANVYAYPSGCCGGGNATTAADGTYVITGLAPGTYGVQASGPSCPPGSTSPPCVSYASQYYNGTYDYSAATLVPATSGTTTHHSSRRNVCDHGPCARYIRRTSVWAGLSFWAD